MFTTGTTGKPKGILLSHRNFIAQGMAAAAWVGMGGADSILAVLPIFHGFGRGLAALMAAPGPLGHVGWRGDELRAAVKAGRYTTSSRVAAANASSA